MRKEVCIIIKMGKKILNINSLSRNWKQVRIDNLDNILIDPDVVLPSTLY